MNTIPIFACVGTSVSVTQCLAHPDLGQLINVGKLAYPLLSSWADNPQRATDLQELTTTPLVAQYRTIGPPRILVGPGWLKYPPDEQPLMMGHELIHHEEVKLDVYPLCRRGVTSLLSYKGPISIEMGNKLKSEVYRAQTALIERWVDCRLLSHLPQQGSRLYAAKSNSYHQMCQRARGHLQQNPNLNAHYLLYGLTATIPWYRGVIEEAQHQGLDTLENLCSQHKAEVLNLRDLICGSLIRSENLAGVLRTIDTTDDEREYMRAFKTLLSRTFIVK